MININAPIIPYQGMGGLHLGWSKEQVENVVEKPLCQRMEISQKISRYTIPNKLLLFFNEKEDRLIKITTLPGYQGKLFGKIGTDTTEDEFQFLEPTLQYDEFSEVFVSEEKGVFIETKLPEAKASWISVFVEDLDKLYEDE
ncbi:MAG: hypothetical protein ACI4PT_00400 [Candidatus Avoscillospira sp.]